MELISKGVKQERFDTFKNTLELGFGIGKACFISRLDVRETCRFIEEDEQLKESLLDSMLQSYNKMQGTLKAQLQAGNALAAKRTEMKIESFILNIVSWNELKINDVFDPIEKDEDFDFTRFIDHDKMIEWIDEYRSTRDLAIAMGLDYSDYKEFAKRFYVYKIHLSENNYD